MADARANCGENSWAVHLERSLPLVLLCDAASALVTTAERQLLADHGKLPRVVAGEVEDPGPLLVDESGTLVRPEAGY